MPNMDNVGHHKKFLKSSLLKLVGLAITSNPNPNKLCLKRSKIMQIDNKSVAKLHWHNIHECDIFLVLSLRDILTY